MEDKINKMEDIYNNSIIEVEKTKKQIDKLKKHLKDHIELIEYYSSNEWILDHNSDRKSVILDQDSIFNMLKLYHELSIELMDLGLEILKKS